MSIDLEKLSPAPWQAHGHELYYSSRLHQQIPSAVDAGFIALARNAFDVMMRRGWGVVWFEDGRWAIVTQGESAHECLAARISLSNDPFTAMVEADKWYRENVEKVNHERTTAGAVFIDRRQWKSS